MTEARPPFPPFTAETAAQKVRMAEDAWNTRDPRARRAGLYARQRLAQPRRVPARPRRHQAFLARKWQRELDYRLIKELWAFHDNRIAVRFAYEWHDDCGNWFRCYGNENWEFDARGLMQRRIASINDLPIADGRAQVPLAARPPAGRSPLVERPGPLTRPRPGPMRVCMKQARFGYSRGRPGWRRKSKITNPQDEGRGSAARGMVTPMQISRSCRPDSRGHGNGGARGADAKGLIGADEARRGSEMLDSRTPALGARPWPAPGSILRSGAGCWPTGVSACEELGVSFRQRTTTA